MPDLRTSLLFVGGLLSQPACLASDAETIMLQINPFLQPVLEAVTSGSSNNVATRTPADSMQLRGTMLAGSNSVANIDGTIIGIGQQLNGYTLVSVQQRHIVLDRNGTQMTLSIDNKAGSDD
jgi:hypothetical protein